MYPKNQCIGGYYLNDIVVIFLLKSKTKCLLKNY